MKNTLYSSLLWAALSLGFFTLSGCNLDQGFSAFSEQTVNTSSSSRSDNGAGRNSPENSDSEDEIDSEDEAVTYCKDYGKALPGNAPASVDALSNVSGSLSISAKSVGKISIHDGSIKILAEKVEGISVNNGRVRIVAPLKSSVVVGDIEKIHGVVVLCGGTGSAIREVTGSIFLVDSYVKTVSGYGGQLHLINSKVDNIVK